MSNVNLVDDLCVFARLYGYARFFNPSDECAATDWNDYAVVGAYRLLRRGESSLFQVLSAWLEPAAPAAALYLEGDDPPEVPRVEKADSVVAWQHIGVELDSEYWPYLSVRTNRERTRPAPERDATWPLFEAVPDVTDVLDVALGCGIMLRLPLALQSVDGHTWPPSDSDFKEDVDDDANNSARALWLATIVTVWNVFQHFYPYFDVVDANWTDVLPATLTDVVAARDREAYRLARDRMLVPLADGHARFYDSGNFGLLPVSFDLVEGMVLVVASEEGCEVPVGAEVVAWNGRPVEEVVTEFVDKLSGSPQFRHFRAMRELARRSWKEEVELSWRPHADADPTATKLVGTGEEFAARSVPGKVVKLDESTWYIDGLNLEIETLDAHMNELERAETIIIDFRGYPAEHALKLLGHFTHEPIWCGLWQVPLIIYPDQKDIAGYSDDGRWQVEPREPYLGAKRVFLTGAAAVSYGETVMEIVEHHELGTIVGEPTAGTNGNVNIMNPPDKSLLYFTGMKVLKQDGSQLHGIGVEPHVVVRPTVAGVRAGRDEVLEAARNQR